VPQCTACGALRPPLSSPSVNFAGKPARFGGVVARILGWVVLLVGGSIALGLGLLFAALELPGVGIAVAAPFAVVSLVLGVLLVWRGTALGRASVLTERATVREALLALAAHRGAVTAADAAHALGIGVAEADAILTEVAKSDPEHLAVDVDNEGVVRYRAAGVPGEMRVRIGEDDGSPAVGESAEENGALEGGEKKAARA
jgi:hypothetical protein